MATQDPRPVEDWIEDVAPGFKAAKAALPALRTGESPWERHTPETAALCKRINGHTNAKLRDYGCRGPDSSACSQSCRACRVLCAGGAA